MPRRIRRAIGATDTPRPFLEGVAEDQELTQSSISTLLAFRIEGLRGM